MEQEWENFLLSTTCSGRGSDAGNEVAEDAAGCVVRVRWGGEIQGGRGHLHGGESSTVGVSELEEERRQGQANGRVPVEPSAGQSVNQSRDQRCG